MKGLSKVCTAAGVFLAVMSHTANAEPKNKITFKSGSTFATANSIADLQRIVYESGHCPKVAAAFRTDCLHSAINEQLLNMAPDRRLRIKGLAEYLHGLNDPNTARLMTSGLKP